MATQKDQSHSGRKSKEYHVFIDHFAGISRAVQTPIVLARELCQAKLISFDLYRNVTSSGIEHDAQVSKLLLSVQSLIELSADNFYVFIEVLEKDLTLLGLANQLKMNSLNSELSHLLTTHNVSLKDIRRECSHDDFFIKIAKKIDDYKDVSKNLCIPERILESITQKKEDDLEKKVAILRSWKRKMGSSATYFMLIQSFLQMEDRLVAEAILTYVKELSSTSNLENDSNFTLELCFDNWDSMSKSEKERRENELLDENEHVRKSFIDLILELIKSFENRKVNPKTMLCIVMSYGIRSSTVEINPDKCYDVHDVFMILLNHSSWFNYKLISVIVEKIGNEAEVKLVEQYRNNNLIPYLRRCIFEIPSQSISPSGSHSDKSSLFLKVFDHVFLTGLEVEAIHRNLAKMLDLNTTILLFQFYKKGCFELFFLVNNAVFNPSQSIYLEWIPSREAYRVTANLVTILSHSQIAEALILSSLVKQKKILWSSIWWTDETAKVTKAISATLETETKLSFCSKVFEEPAFTLSSSYDVYVVTISGLCLTSAQRKFLTQKCCRESIEETRRVSDESLSDIAGLLLSCKQPYTNQVPWSLEELIKIARQNNLAFRSSNLFQKRDETNVLKMKNRVLYSEVQSLRKNIGLSQPNSEINADEQKLKDEIVLFETKTMTDITVLEKEEKDLEMERISFEASLKLKHKELDMLEVNLYNQLQIQHKKLKQEKQKLNRISQNKELWQAAFKGDITGVKSAIAQSADINCHNLDEDHQTALHYSSRAGHIEIVKLLLTAKADPNICDKYHQTALHYASSAGHIEIVQLLLTAKADFNICDKDHNTALHYASSAGHIEIVQLLLTAKADPNICDKNQETDCTVL